MFGVSKRVGPTALALHIACPHSLDMSLFGGGEFPDNEKTPISMLKCIEVC